MVSLVTPFLYHICTKIDWIDIEDEHLQFDVKKKSFGSSYKSQKFKYTAFQSFLLLVLDYSHMVSVSGIVSYILTA